MKLSEMTLQQQAAVICSLCEPVGTLMEDQRVGHALGKLAHDPDGGATFGELIGRFVKYVVPVLLNCHLREMVRIVSIMTNKAEKDVEKLGIVGITKEVIAMMDGDLLDFFKSSADTERTKSQA